MPSRPGQPRRYGALLGRLPGISTSVLADRLRRLERAGVVVREPGAVGAGVEYALTARGQELQEALRALRRWGVGFLADPAADGSAQQSFDVSYVAGIAALADGQFQLARPADFFWEASAAALAHSDVATGTMMGFPCLRLSGAFFASCDHRSGDLIVKLPRHRVEQLIQAGTGKPFAPAGRTFANGSW
jgi:DNA-binding HxlR family transcriptional regulator